MLSYTYLCECKYINPKESNLVIFVRIKMWIIFDLIISFLVIHPTDIQDSDNVYTRIFTAVLFIKVKGSSSIENLCFKLGYIHTGESLKERIAFNKNECIEMGQFPKDRE